CTFGGGQVTPATGRGDAADRPHAVLLQIGRMPSAKSHPRALGSYHPAQQGDEPVAACVPSFHFCYRRTGNSSGSGGTNPRRVKHSVFTRSATPGRGKQGKVSGR